MIPEPRRIWVRAPNPLGDAVMAEPALRALAEHFPDARLEIGISRELAALARGWRFASRVWPLPPEPRGRWAGWSRWRQVRRLRRGGYDLALLLPNSRRVARLVARAGIPRVVGYDGGQRSRELTRAVPAAQRGSDRARHMIEHYWGLAEALGSDPLPQHQRLETDRAATAAILAQHPRTTPRLACDEAMQAAARRLLERHGVGSDALGVLAPGAARGPAKQWPAARFAALARRLAARGLRVLLVGSAAEHAAGRAIRAAFGRGEPGAPIDLIGHTDLEALIGLLARARVFVGNDTGAAHLAAALGRPGVALFGPTSPTHSAPVGPRLRVVQRVIECAPCFEASCPLGHQRCLADLAPERVLEALHAADAAPAAW